jgi:hypothetical protein
MPLLTVNLTSRIFQEVSPLIERGLYTGLDQFMEIAALNQLALERGITPEAESERASGGAPGGGTQGNACLAEGPRGG